MALADLLAAVRADAVSKAEPALTDTCTIQRAARVTDGQGGWTTTYPTHQSGVPCAVGIQGSGGSVNEAVLGEAVRADAPYLIRVPVGTDITSDDRLVVGSRTFEVVEPLVRTYQAVLRLVCREVG